MASKFQSRLVGTIILMAIGVIVLPDVFDGEKNHYKEEVATIPLKPDLNDEIETFEVQEPEQDNVELPGSPVQVTISGSNSTVTQPASVISPAPTSTVSNDVATVTVNMPEEKNAYQDSAWIIQLMALKNEENAINLVKDLKQRNYKAFTKKENGFVRVIIGPDVSKTKLERQLLELEKITGAKGQLLNFKPLNP